MSRFLARATEVVRIASDRFTKVPHPNSIDDRPSRQRIVLARNPFCEREPTSLDAFRNGQLLNGTEDTQHSRFHFGPFGEWIATDQDTGRFQFSCCHAIHWNTSGCIDQLCRNGATTVHRQCKRFVSLELPLQSFESFASNSLQSKLLGSKSDELWWKFALRYFLSQQGIAGSGKQVGVILAFVCLCLRVTLLGRFNSRIPVGWIEPFFGKPLLCVFKQHGI